MALRIFLVIEKTIFGDYCENRPKPVENVALNDNK